MIKNKCKKVISMAISLTMLTTMFSVNVFAGGAVSNSNQSIESGKYEENECGEKVKYSFDKSTGELKIYGEGEMDTYSGDNVSLRPWDKYKDQIKFIIVEDGVTNIGDLAFVGCKKLTSVIIHDTVKNIGICAFGGCISLKSITISNSVTKISQDAFRGCLGLTSITIPNSVKEIGYGVFANCMGLTSITIPDSVTEIGAFAFSECKGLASVKISNNVKEILNGVFAGCESLTSVTIPDGVTEIYDEAFADCICLKSIMIPDSVISIGDKTFDNCPQLEELPAKKENVRFSFDESNKELVIYGNGKMPDFSALSPSPWYFCTIPFVRIEDGITRISKCAFTDGKGFREIVIPDSVTEIGRMAFAGCRDLTTVTIGKGVKEIDGLAFWECKNLNSVTYLGKSDPNCREAFDDCPQLKEVNVPFDYEGDVFCEMKVVKGTFK